MPGLIFATNHHTLKALLFEMSNSQALKEIIVIGAGKLPPRVDPLTTLILLVQGVIGLTTAVKIQEKGGYHVTIIAEVLPTDPKTIKYTSHWAVRRRYDMSRFTLILTFI